MQQLDLGQIPLKVFFGVVEFKTEAQLQSSYVKVLFSS